MVRGCITVAAQHGAGDRPDVDGFLADLAGVLDELPRPQPERLATTAIASLPKGAATSAIKVEDVDERAVVKVDIGKMDHIIDLVGELAIAQAQVAAHPELASLASRELGRAIGLLGRVAKELQHASLAMRMVALKGTFDRMARVARDTARSLGKPISFVIEGGQTELDRTMVDAIYDPLVHLVRNAIDHGLEGTIERVRRGKPTTGTLTLRAYHHAGMVVVELIDDGGGLDHDKILARARSRGLVYDEIVGGTYAARILDPASRKGLAEISFASLLPDQATAALEAGAADLKLAYRSEPGLGSHAVAMDALVAIAPDGLVTNAVTSSSGDTGPGGLTSTTLTVSGGVGNEGACIFPM